MNYWLRARIGAQFFTVVALVGGTYYLNKSNVEKKAQEEAEAAAERERERLAFEERLKAAEEAHRLEQEAMKAQSSSSSSGAARFNPGVSLGLTTRGGRGRGEGRTSAPLSMG